MTAPSEQIPRRVALVTLGCARNEVDSEELAGRLEADGWELVDDAADADAVVVNTCGFVERRRRTRSTPCSRRPTSRPTAARRRSSPWAAWPSATATSSPSPCPRPTPSSASTTTPTSAPGSGGILAGEAHVPHAPRDRRLLLPLTPSSGAPPRSRCRVTPRRPTSPRASPRRAAPGSYAAGSATDRARRSSSRPGCDRRCAFCAIPSFRGSFVSRRPSDVLDEARWLAEHGVRELVLVSENSTSYGKDLGDLRLLETLLPELAAVDGIDRVRVSYLQPAETRPSLRRGDRDDPGRRPVLRPVVPARRRAGAAPDAPLRRHRVVPRPARLGARRSSPVAGARSNVIVGLPGRDRGRRRRARAVPRRGPARRRRACSATPTRTAPRPRPTTGRSPDDVVRERVERLSALVEELTAQRAEDRIGETVEVLVEDVAEGEDGLVVEGRGAHQAPEVDGEHAARRPAGSTSRPCASVTSSPPRSSAPTASTSSPSRGAPRGDPSGTSRPRRRPGPVAVGVNLPNALTVLRLLLVPVFAWLLLRDGGDDSASRIWAAVVFVVAGATDFVDGELARRQGLVTTFGKVADPIADKALTGTALVGLSYLGELPWWVTDRDPRARDRRDAAAVLGDPARRDPGEPRRQGQDRGADAGDPAVPAAAHRAGW